MKPEKLAKAVRAGDRRALAQAITLIESSRPEDWKPANVLLGLLAPHAGRSIRIGISGVPGVGKSTFIENFGNHVIDEGHKIAVLAVDPSSAAGGKAGSSMLRTVIAAFVITGAPRSLVDAWIRIWSSCFQYDVT